MRRHFVDISEKHYSYHPTYNETKDFDELRSMKLIDFECDERDAHRGSGPRGESWLASGNECFTGFRRYLMSLYATMMIFFGDGVDPQSEVEILFTILCGIFGLIVGAVLIGQTAEIISNMHRAEAKYKDKVRAPCAASGAALERSTARAEQCCSRFVCCSRSAAASRAPLQLLALRLLLALCVLLALPPPPPVNSVVARAPRGRRSPPP
jgi:hypothetical protein